MSLKTDLVWYWDLSAAGATITDQHSGLVLSRVGTTTTDSTGGPDGGPCINFGAAAGKYRNASVAKTVSYDDGFSVNIWTRATGTSNTGNWLISHRNNPDLLPDNRHFQIIQRFQLGFSSDLSSVFDAVSTERNVFVAQSAINTWQMLTLRDTGTTSELYRNGSLVATSSTVLGARQTAAAAFAIGGDSWNSTILANLNHRGQLAMAGVWGRPLTDAEVVFLYNGGNGRKYDKLEAGSLSTIVASHYAALGI